MARKWLKEKIKKLSAEPKRATNASKKWLKKEMDQLAEEPKKITKKTKKWVKKQIEHLPNPKEITQESKKWLKKQIKHLPDSKEMTKKSKKWIKKQIKHLPDSEQITKESKKIVKESHLDKIKSLQNPMLWRFNRDTIAKGVAAGLFAAMLPLMPFQMLIAIIVAILLRGNIPLALCLSWISNPITLVPITYFTYYIGDLLLGNPITSKNVINFSWKYETSVWLTLKTWLIQFGKGFFVGLPVVAIGAALLGYLAVKSIYFLIDHIRANHTRNN